MSFSDSAKLLLLASGAPDSDGCFGLVAAVSLSPPDYFYIDDFIFASLLVGLFNISKQLSSSEDEFSLTESS